MSMEGSINVNRLFFLVSVQAWNVNEYNEDQKRAIETAYAMVKQHPGLPKICLIHGPPGTGKSKTIVGLLSRVLREVSEPNVIVTCW